MIEQGSSLCTYWDDLGWGGAVGGGIWRVVEVPLVAKLPVSTIFSAKNGHLLELDLRETQIDTRNKRHNRPPLVSSVQSLGSPVKLDPHIRPSRPSNHTAHPLVSTRTSVPGTHRARTRRL